ncbi:TRAP transporter small permease [Nisaea acidiphila]|uniref:TRAP transporter small permease protein n=1 Tax=Nisaea acidiphila TaxID=1862145 RepID=A0A9J7AUU2_9PROT|nr:TRAP transporter small permease [Nisaea acidiphila]UUX50886.1 TRAP transporter small permease [Nisaea acidiphila]
MNAPRSVPGPLSRAEASLDRLLDLMAMLSGAVLFLMMFLVVANTLTRKLFNWPITGAFEITETMLTLAIFLALAYTQKVGSHISVDVLNRHFSGALKRILEFSAPVLGAVCFGWATYASGLYALDSYAMAEQEWGSITYPIWPVKMLICFGLGALTLRYLLEIGIIAHGERAGAEDGQ